MKSKNSKLGAYPFKIENKRNVRTQNFFHIELNFFLTSHNVIFSYKKLMTQSNFFFLYIHLSIVKKVK